VHSEPGTSGDWDLGEAELKGMGDLGRGGGGGNELGLLSEAIGEEGTTGGGGGRGSLSGPGVVGGVGGRTEKVGGRTEKFGGRKDRLGGLGGGIGFRLEMDFASSLTGIFCCSTVDNLGFDPRLGLSVRCCGLLSDLPRPIQFLEWASRGIGEGRLSVGDCNGSLLWTRFESDADDDFPWENDSFEGGGGGGSGGARGAIALWISEKVGGRGELEEVEEEELVEEELEEVEEEVGEEEADWKVSKVRGVA